MDLVLPASNSFVVWWRRLSWTWSGL